MSAHKRIPFLHHFSPSSCQVECWHSSPSSSSSPSQPASHWLTPCHVPKTVHVFPSLSNKQSLIQQPLAQTMQPKSLRAPPALPWITPPGAHKPPRTSVTVDVPKTLNVVATWNAANVSVMYVSLQVQIMEGEFGLKMVTNLKFYIMKFLIEMDTELNTGEQKKDFRHA